MLLNCGVGEYSRESLGLQGDQISQSSRKSVLNIHWKDWCWRWNSRTLATWCKELTPWKKPWCCERLKAGGGGDNRGWDGWRASPTRWTWIWASSRSWWWTGMSGVLQSMGSQRIRHDWATELTDLTTIPWNCVCVLSHSVVSDSATPWTIVHQAPLSTRILQARIPEWVAMPSYRGSSQPRDRTQASHTTGRFFTIWVTREAQGYWSG